MVPVDGRAHCPIVIRLPVVPRVVRRVVLHVKTANHGNFVDLIDEIIIVESGLPRKDILTVVVDKPLVELLSLERSIWIDQFVKRQSG